MLLCARIETSHSNVDQSLVVVGRTFPEVSNYASVIEDMQREGCDKRPICQGRFYRSPSSARFKGGIPYVGHPLYLSF